MGKVIMNAAVSVDGYIASDDNSVGPLFDYYGNGEVTATFVEGGMEFHVTAPTAEYLPGDRRRHWQHLDRAPFTFVTDGVEARSWPGEPRHLLAPVSRWSVGRGKPGQRRQ